MFSAALENFRRMRLLADTESRLNRNNYYLTHPGLRPLITVNKPLSDNNGIGLFLDTNEDDLKITNIDLNIYWNTIKHFCDRYDVTKTMDKENKLHIPKLVVRRGFPFQIVIGLNRVYQRHKDKVSIQLAFGNRPKVPKRTLIRMPVDSGHSKSWTATLKKVNANELVVEITPPSNCFVGIWRLVGYVTDSNLGVKLTKFKEIFILFNPFNPADEVYLNDANERDEYVMNEYGTIFVGTCGTWNNRYWEFSQFHGNVLECTMYILDESDLPFTDRGRPVLVCRRLAAMINNANAGVGVLEGRWDGKYTDGTAPTTWQGSARILQQYWKTKKTVKYGQCWVFSGVLNTVCRTLGIPCRCISNFCSAHDSDSSVTIDRFYSKDKELEEHMNEDSIWNFHCWNDVYMARPDLADESYGGWQVLDATPQETSDGIYCCGPCPLAAVKRGDANAKYDSPFIIAEVNADIALWKKGTDGHYKMFEIQKREIGRAILTKMVNKMQPMSVSNLYKFEEGSLAERASIRNAFASGSRTLDMQGKGPEDVQVEIIADGDTALGTDFNVKLEIQNHSRHNRSITGNFAIMTTFYTGVTSHFLHKEKLQFVLKPYAKQTFSSLTRYSEYADKLEDQENIIVRAFADVEETKQTTVENKFFRLKKPDINIHAADKAKLGDVLIMQVSFKNPLPVKLTNCILYVDGTKITGHLTLRQRNVGVGQMFSTKVELHPSSTGKYSILLNFSCNQMDGVIGIHWIQVEK